ncbi:MAG: P-loop NTPase fold protein [Treponema sp.]|nr:P-loop NTPase fold protein [Treponema sp.]
MSQEIKFLSNAPSGEDLFDGKSQESIANVIVDELENNAYQEHRGKCQKMIGIEGCWGSGKSNLIKIVEKKLSEKDAKKFYFFLYDVWGHQEDLQRKAVLNELVDFLIKEKVVKNCDDENSPYNWKERAKKITGILTERKTKNIPKVSTGILLCMLILLSVPVIDKVADLEDFKGFWSVVIALVPIILSAVIFLIWWLCRLVKGISIRPFKFPVCDSFDETIAEMLSVYKDKEIESSNREYVNEVNPSVVDFRNFFSDLSGTLKNRHLVIFFDNMDRLPKEKIENLWSSIHTFFAENNGYKNISCIVSFDRGHIKNAFSSDDVSKENCGDDYIDKTFDVVYRVAPPVLSDWKKFFKIKWNDAFGSVEKQEEYEYVVQAYDLLSGKNGLTPRSIIKFINESALLKKIFSDIPERYIAIFILKKNELIENALNKECLGNLKSIYEHDDNYDKYIAALVYQVSPEKALSAVYVASLKRALELGNKDELERIGKASFFSDILDEAIDAVENLDNAIVSIDMLPQEFLNEVRTKKLWTDLYNRADEREIEETSITRLFGVMKESQEVLLKHVDDNLRILLMKKLLAPFRKSDFNWKGYTPDTFVQLVEKFNEYIHLDKLVKILPSLKIEPNAYIEVLKNHGEILKKIPFVCVELETHLASLNFVQLLGLDCLANIPEETKKHLNAETWLNNLFVQNQVYNEGNFLKLLKLFSAFPNAPMNPNLINWNGMGQLLVSTQVSDLKGILLAIRLIYCSHPIATNLPFDAMLKKTLPDGVKKSMLVYFSTHKPVEDILADENMLQTYTVVQDYARERIALGDYEMTGSGLFNLLPRINNISQILNIDLAPLYSKMLSFYESKKEVFKRLIRIEQDVLENVEKILPKGTLEFVVQHPSDFSTELIQWLVSYFDSWPKEMWMVRLENQNLYGVKEAIVIKYKWSQNAKDAIEMYLIEVSKGNKPVPNKSQKLGVIESLDNSFKEHLFKNIRDEFRSGRAKMNEDLFIFLGDWLLKYGFVQQFAGDVLRTMIPSSLLENDSAAQIIADNYDLVKSLFEEESESEDWLKKAKEIADSKENYPLKGFVE